MNSSGCKKQHAEHTRTNHHAQGCERHGESTLALGQPTSNPRADDACDGEKGDDESRSHPRFDVGIDRHRSSSTGC